MEYKALFAESWQHLSVYLEWSLVCSMQMKKIKWHLYEIIWISKSQINRHIPSLKYINGHKADLIDKENNFFKAYKK